MVGKDRVSFDHFLHLSLEPDCVELSTSSDRCILIMIRILLIRFIISIFQPLCILRGSAQWRVRTVNDNCITTIK